MRNEKILELENIIDREIDGYKNIEKLYTDKKEILINGKSVDLLDVDVQITNTFKNINDLFEARKIVSKDLDLPTFSMTDIINNIKAQDAEAARKFEKKKEIVNTLAHKIFELEKVNVELLKHGITLTNKTLEAMLKGVTAVTKEYNQKGKNISNEQLEMSSIVEEA